MKVATLGRSSLVCSRLAYGCWRIAGTWEPSEVTPERELNGRRAIITAYEAGYTLFDHADIYCQGAAERIFGQVLQEVGGMRERIRVASKCGIRRAGEPAPDSPYRYDFSATHIIASCEQSLKRLGIEVIDLYHLHRPDYLCHPDEVAEAFTRLKQAGKVREFGVSNFRPSQVTALQKACPMPLIVNQIEISLAKLDAFNDGTIDQCLAEKMTPMAWSPLAGGHLGNRAKDLLPSQQGYRPAKIVAALDGIANGRGASRAVIALAWLLRHPSGIVPIVGSINPENIREAAKAVDVDLTRDEWYRLLDAACGQCLP